MKTAMSGISMALIVIFIVMKSGMQCACIIKEEVRQTITDFHSPQCIDDIYDDDHCNGNWAT